MRTQWIEDIQTLRELEPHWLQLYERSAEASPFQHPGWLLPWWGHFGSGRLFSIALWDGTRLEGLFPAFLHPWDGRRQVTFLGNGVSDRLHVLAPSHNQDQAACAVLDGLQQRCEEWDIVRLECVPPGSPLGAGDEGNAVSSRGLPSSHEELDASLPHGLRRNLRRYGERLRVLGAVSFVRTAQKPEFSHAFDSFLNLHRARWQSEGERGMFAGVLEEFHREAAANLAGSGQARCLILSLDQKPIASIYGFIDKQRFWSYQSGYDPQFSPCSPGALILHFAMQCAIEEGCTSFDFLRGAEPYKQTWGATFATDRTVVLCHTAAR